MYAWKPKVTMTDNAGREHVLFSAFDLCRSCFIIVTVLAISMLINSFRFPRYANIVKTHWRIAACHPAELPGHFNIAARLWGSAAGCCCHSLLARWVLWLIVAVVTVDVAANIGEGLHASLLPVLHLVGATVKLAFFVPYYLSLRVDCLTRLLRKLLVWNFIVSLLIAGTCSCLHNVRRSRDGTVTATSIIAAITDWATLCVFPVADAMPPQIVTYRMRVGGSIAIAALHAWLYTDTLMSRSTLYDAGFVIELKVRGVLVFSSFDWRCKGITLVIFFALHMLYRLVFYPDSAIVLQRRVLMTTLHKPKSLAGSEMETNDETEPECELDKVGGTLDEL